MTRDNQSERWLVIDPDPRVLSKLCLSMGVKGVQVEQIQPSNRDFIREQRPVHGVILLLHQVPPAINGEETSSNGIYFSNQIVREGYATHALINILMNCGEMVDIGSTLKEFKEFTREFTPIEKGHSLSSSHVLREASNNIAKRQESRGVFHAITYVHYGGFLWELDGCRKSPSRLVACTETTWLGVAQNELRRKADMLYRHQTPYSMWAVIEDRRQVYHRQLVGKAYLRQAVENELDSLYPAWRVTLNINRWEEEYQYHMEHNVNQAGKELVRERDYCRVFEDLPVDEQISIQTSIKTDVRGWSEAELTDRWMQTQDESLRLYERLGTEYQKHKEYRDDTVRRKYNYEPFIEAYIKCLAKHKLLDYNQAP
ncbi:hypothetical protein J3Q64DRAFT_1765052 [Phycomyces blakesleeanus]|uniref:ubiquitinyl hydrolase 1 n=2 Tax=Phycomyces blakesleeanus TaxID=4837 RepID=A0A162PPK8_PHYB8|nr:hypothetical protein PHYBLDRAFT_61164 [Phycomyces blakesleeanus NRRL 1555(-)]OAD74787.1 hypothetical protein PHYBLDRAFT_61164 [Phycomyces blakesleeanus NRRL 1555(-)]|eukprot:XP_018292827.1 hypothetical protein PHYBLDRAFT_61164 [Phycomyces blakesleeanus NRRL 1555(-)]